MTSAARADCNGASKDSASRTRAKRTVFMRQAPISKKIERPWARSIVDVICDGGIFALQQSRWRGLGFAPCDATAVAAILTLCRRGCDRGHSRVARYGDKP